MRSRKCIIIGILSGIAAFLALGIPTALIPTGLFLRMVAPGLLDYVFLGLIAAMLGAFIGLHLYKRSDIEGKEGWAAAGGTLSGVFALACPICNVLLVSAFGAAALLTWFEPARPLLGVIGVGALGAALYFKARNISSCSKCIKRKGMI